MSASQQTELFQVEFVYEARFKCAACTIVIDSHVTDVILMSERLRGCIDQSAFSKEQENTHISGVQ